MYPAFIQKEVVELAAPRAGRLPTSLVGNGKMVMDVMHAGATIVGGTDRPLAIKVHGDILSEVLIGMTPFEALKTVTVNSAKALALDAGTIEAGKLADIVLVEGNPLENVENAHKVKRVIANGRVYELDELLKGAAVKPPATAAAARAR